MSRVERQEINWAATGANIKLLLHDKISQEDLEAMLGYVDRSLTNKFAGKGISIEDMLFFAKKAGCKIDDLVVTNNDLDEEKVRDIRQIFTLSKKNVDKVKNDDMEQEWPIESLIELILAMPFLNYMDLLELSYDTILEGLWEVDRRDELLLRLKNLYEKTPELPAKSYITLLRKHKLRKKQIERVLFNSVENLKEIEELMFSEVIYREKIKKRFKFCSEILNKIEKNKL